MARQTGNNIKLGAFVMAGLVILVISLYLVGKNQSYFGSNIRIKARFSNINGLMEGNNVRFSGIQAGTVRKIHIIDDTTIEVTMQVDKNLREYIHKNAFANIGTEGLMGNKVINITPNNIPAAVIEDNDLLTTVPRTNTEEIISTLSKTNSNLEDISSDLSITVKRINNSLGVWRLLNDTSISSNLHTSLQSLNNAANQVNEMAGTLNAIARDIKQGKGTAGVLLSDDKTATNLKESIAHLNSVSKNADGLVTKLNKLVAETQNDLSHGKGIAHSILSDSAEARKLSNSLSNIEKGTAAFNEDMEAFKHNFLTKGYFKKEEKKKKKNQASSDQ